MAQFIDRGSDDDDSRCSQERYDSEDSFLDDASVYETVESYAGRALPTQHEVLPHVRRDGARIQSRSSSRGGISLGIPASQHSEQGILAAQRQGGSRGRLLLPRPTPVLVTPSPAPESAARTVTRASQRPAYRRGRESSESHYSLEEGIRRRDLEQRGMVQRELYIERSRRGRDPQARRGSRLEGRVRLLPPREGGREDSASTASTPLIRGRRPRNEQRHMSRLSSGDGRRLYSRMRTIGSSPLFVRSSESVHPLRWSPEDESEPPGTRLATPESVSDPDVVERLPTPDPWTFPAHLDKEKLKGVVLPGKRLGRTEGDEPVPRWATQFYLLTFSQTGYEWPYAELARRVSEAGGRCHISRELHGDGGYHFHAFLDMQRKWDFEGRTKIHRFCVGERALGSSSSCPGQAHCNILQIRKTPFHAFDYTEKEGDVVFSDCPRPEQKGPGVTRDDMWKQSVTLPSKNEFLEDVRGHSPRDSVLFGRQIQTYADKKYGKDLKAPKTPRWAEDGVYVHWERYPEVRKWVLDYIPDPITVIKSMSRGESYPMDTQAADEIYVSDRSNASRRRPKSLVICGSSRLGKTLFATNLGKHIHFVKEFNLGKLLAVGADNIDYCCFDDISWKNSCFANEGYKAWIGAQDEFDVTDKFEHKTEIKWGKPCIVLRNRDPFLHIAPDEREFFEDNCIMVQLGPRDATRSYALASSDAHDGTLIRG